MTYTGTLSLEVRSRSLQKSNSEPAIGICVCGRKLDEADVYVYRSHTDRCLFHRCACGVEWTEHQTGIDPTDPVSSDEVIAVHICLTTFEGSISELLLHHSA
jgi:hypothetical protein